MKHSLFSQNFGYFSALHRLLVHSALKEIIPTALCVVLLATTSAQDAQTYYDQGFEKQQAGQFKEAIKLYDKAIELNPALTGAWVDRGYAKIHIDQTDAAIADFTQAIKLDSGFKTAWLNRGSVKLQMSDYTGSLADLNYAISLDSNYGRAFYARGYANEKLGRADAACNDFKTALRFGITIVQEKVDMCNGNANTNKDQANFTVLDEEQDYQKLIAVQPQLLIREKDTSLGMVFFLFLSKMNIDISGYYKERLTTDSHSSIEVVLENGEIVKLLNSPHSPNISKKKPLMFMALFNHEQTQLLFENNIQKINFHSADGHYEYLIKDNYAGRIKSMVRAFVSN